MKATVLAPVAALVIGSTAGFFIGKSADSASNKDADTASDNRSLRRTVSGSGSSSSETSRGNRVKSAEEALAIPGQNNRLKALMEYYAGLDPSQFEEEAKKMEDLPWSERVMVGYLLFARWGEEDPTAAMAYTKTMGFAGGFVRGTVMQSWAAKYPQDAATYYTQNTNEFNLAGRFGGRGGATSTASVIATEWARQDSAGAMAWAESLEGRDKRDAVQGIISEAAKEDPAAASAMLSSVTDADAKKNAQNSIALEWGKKDWGEAQAWISTLPTDDQADATARALRGLADEDPQAAAANIGSLTEGDTRDDAVADIAREWGREDPSGAAKWLMETGSSDAQEEGIGRVVSTWVGQDADAAFAFINEQPTGDVRDEAASSFVMANQSGDIQQNIQLAETIDGERDRSRAIAVTAMSWAREDKEAATNYINTTEALSDQAKERVIRFTEGGGRGGRGGRGR